MNKDSLQSLPNVGPVLAQLLRQTGIASAEDLRAKGTMEVFQMVRNIDPGACLHMLYGVEGAIQGIPDKQLSQAKKEELRLFFHQLNKKS